MIQYQVVGACAHATVNTAQGRVRQLHSKGTLLPPDAPEIEHLLSVGLVAPVAGLPAVAVAEPEVVGPVGPTTSGSGPVFDQPVTDQQPADDTAQPSGGQATTDSAVEAQRDEARAKLESAGGKPTGRHGQPVWTEYLVAKGYDYGLVSKESKEELQRIAEGLPDQ